MTLTEFLLARFDEDEARARSMWELKVRQRALGAPIDPLSWPTPDRVLAEVEAKRRIVAAFEEKRVRRDIYNRDYDGGEYDFNANDLRARLASNAHCRGLEIAMLALALPYADHPDYDPQWRP